MNHDLILDLLTIVLRHPLSPEDARVVERVLDKVANDLERNAHLIIAGEVARQKENR